LICVFSLYLPKQMSYSVIALTATGRLDDEV
jgi:hypothetical protein